MPAYEVSRSIVIDAEASAVFECLADFKTWPAWSPWLIAEPETELEFAQDGQSYSWSGTFVGAGAIEIVTSTAPQSLHFDLTILKPFKSQSLTQFELEPREDGTRLTWTMKGKLPFFLFWMKPTLVNMISMDYDRGLLLLKDFLERDGDVLSALDFEGVKPFEASFYLGVKGRCRFDQIGPSMDRDFDTLFDYLSRFEQAVPANAYGIYHDWDMKTGLCVYTVAVPVEGQPSSLDPGFVTGEIPSCQAYCVTHTGAHRHVGNAWAAGMMRERAKLFKLSKKVTPFEIYTHFTDAVDESAFSTQVMLPIK